MARSKGHTQRMVEDPEHAEDGLDIEMPDAPAANSEISSNAHRKQQTAPYLSAGNKAIGCSGAVIHTAARSRKEDAEQIGEEQQLMEALILEDLSLYQLVHNPNATYGTLVAIIKGVVVTAIARATSGDGGRRIRGDPSLPACFVNTTFPEDNDQFPKSEFLILTRACKIYTETRSYHESTEITDRHALSIAKGKKAKFRLYAFRFFPDLPKELRNKIWGLSFTTKPAEVVVIRVCFTLNAGPTYGFSFRFPSPLSPLLHTCQESREELLGTYSEGIKKISCKKTNSYTVFNKHDRVVLHNMHGLTSWGVDKVLGYFKMAKKSGVVESAFSELRELVLEQRYFEVLQDEEYVPVLGKLLEIFPALKKIVIYNEAAEEAMDCMIKEKRALKLGKKVSRLPRYQQSIYDLLHNAIDLRAAATCKFPTLEIEFRGFAQH